MQYITLIYIFSCLLRGPAYRGVGGYKDKYNEIFQYF